MKLTKNADLDKYGYSGCGIGFDVRSQISLPIGEWGKNIIFGVDNSSSKHLDNRIEDILVLGDGSTDAFDDTTTTSEAKYFVNITKSRKKNCLSLH